MKKLVGALLLMVFLQPLFAQTAKDIFTNPNTSVVNIGIDFSKTTFVNPANFTNSVDIKERFLASWNNLLRTEFEKFNVQEAFHFNIYNIDISAMNKYNETHANHKTFVKNSKDKAWTAEDVQAMVRAYAEVPQDNDLAFVWIPEYFDKDEGAKIHVVFFNPKTRDIVWHEAMEGSPGGFGLRNFWGGAFYDIIKTIKKPMYKNWSKEYK